MQSRFWIQGCPDSQSTCRFALKSQPDRPASQTEPARETRQSQPDSQRADRQREQTERFPDRDGRPPAALGRPAQLAGGSLIGKEGGGRRADLSHSSAGAASGAKRRERVARGA